MQQTINFMLKRTKRMDNRCMRNFRVKRCFWVLTQILYSRLKIINAWKLRDTICGRLCGTKNYCTGPTWGYAKIKEWDRSMTKTSPQGKFGKTNTNSTYWYKMPTVQNLHIWYILFYILGREKKDCMKIVNRKISS